MVETQKITTGDLRTKTCATCGDEFTYAEVGNSGFAIFRPKLCDSCFKKRAVAAEREQAELRTRTALEAWERTCPPLYRDTDVKRLTIGADALNQILNWQINPKGIGLAGESGAGKTRAMFLLLKRLHDEGARIVATTAKRFEYCCHQMFEKSSDARQQLDAARHAKVLFLDDIGKEKYTERVESEFYDLIEYRTSHLLPILWTANASGQQLVNMMGADRGAPIVRRLREFSTVISV